MSARSAASDVTAMKKTVFLFVLPLLLAVAAFADDQLRGVQSELKTQGFFYGDVNGQPSPETTAALRRYQIRNGLEVTGTVNKETLDALSGGPKPMPQVAPPPAPKLATPAPAPAPPAKKPPTNLRKDETVEQADRAFLEREEARRRAADTDVNISPMPAPPTVPHDPSIVSPPAPLDAPGEDFPVLFAHTPYATAPRSVQQGVLRRAQSILAGRGFYRDIVDGLPGLATEEALLSYQRAARLTLTGRLDLETLSRLGLLPGRGFTRGAEPPPASTQRVYRGIWVN